jgi:hypothetical protein
MTRRGLTFCISVSSPFGNTVAEWNALQEGVFPKLGEYCHHRNACIPAIGSRWGATEGVVLDAQTITCVWHMHGC